MRILYDLYMVMFTKRMRVRLQEIYQNAIMAK